MPDPKIAFPVANRAYKRKIERAVPMALMSVVQVPKSMASVGVWHQWMSGASHDCIYLSVLGSLVALEIGLRQEVTYRSILETSPFFLQVLLPNSRDWKIAN